MEKVKLNRQLFLAMIEQENSEVLIVTSTLGVVTLNIN
jgi:hypothetical protein